MPAIVSRDDQGSFKNHSRGFLNFLNDAPTVFHAVDHYVTKLEAAGFRRLNEREDWEAIIKPGGKYFLTRNYSSLITFSIGQKYQLGNGIAMIGSHIDAVTMKVKPVSKASSVGFHQLGVAPYAGGGNMTWWDRDLGLGGRVMVKQTDNTVKQMLVRFAHPIAKIPTLAPHFGQVAVGPFDKETQMTPIIGLENELEKQLNALDVTDSMNNPQKNHSTRLLKAIAQNLNIQVEQIMDLELELFDHQPAQVFGLDSELLSVPRCDDKLCSYAAMEALLNNSKNADFIQNSGTISLVFLADNEEVGSKTRQGAASNILPNVIERIVGVMNARQSKSMHNLLSMTYGKSFLISADVTHAVNPNFVGAYEHNMMPRLNVGPVISCDPNAHMTTDAPGKVILQMIADKVGSKLQLFQIRNGQPSGGTIGPMLSAATGVRALDLGIRKANCTERTKSDFLAQLSMHSIRATTGSDDPGLGVKYFEAYFMHFEEIEKEVIVD